MISTPVTKSNVAPGAKRIWTILELLNHSQEYLSGKGIDSPRLTSELLLSHVLRCSRIDLYSHFDQPLSGDELAQYKSCLKRRVTHEPLQYILGETEFMGLKFFVDRRVLIPRPETEILVENVIKICKENGSQPLRILDVGAGSGSIAVALAKKLDDATLDAIDNNEDALVVARENVRRHGLEGRVNLIHADIFRYAGAPSQERYDWIVSNPPYISRDEFKCLQPEVRDHEPASALTDDGDGLSFFSVIVKNGERLLRSGGRVAVEVAYNQGDVVRSMFVDGGYGDVCLIKDYDGNGRVVMATLE